VNIQMLAREFYAIERKDYLRWVANVLFKDYKVSCYFG
jgi:hypothetical protein